MKKICVLYLQQTPAKAFCRKLRNALMTQRTECEITWIYDIEKIMPMLLADPYRFDILFLSVADDRLLEVARTLRSKNSAITIVPILDKVQAASTVLRCRPSGCLRARFTDAELNEELCYALSEQTDPSQELLILHLRDHILRVACRDISHFESNLRIVQLHFQTDAPAVAFYGKLDDVAGLLTRHPFVRCHQSYLVSLEAIRCIRKVQRTILMSNGKEIPISRSYWNQVVEAYTAYMCPCPTIGRSDK